MIVDSRNSDKALVLGLTEVGRHNVDQVGRKAAMLGGLAASGFPVPGGIVLTTAAFERFLRHNKLDAQSSKEDLQNAAIPGDIVAILSKSTEFLGDVEVAVRSSGVAEDLADASYAGQYTTVLGVRDNEELLEAVRRCWVSAFSHRVEHYEAMRNSPQQHALAILIQRMVAADAAGVALTANPLSGDRSETVISAVTGVGERLVSGEATPDEWIVSSDGARCVSSYEGAIDARLAQDIAEVARRIEERQGFPQDVEWAVEAGAVVVLQARPMTALPAQVSWDPPEPGAWSRHFRIGEWLSDPVTPLFESWLLTTLEKRMYANFKAVHGVPPPQPLHLIISGWYFCTLNFIPATAGGMLRMLVRYVLPRALVRPRRVSVMLPATARFGVELFMREWREEVLPRYRQVVEQMSVQVESASQIELIHMIDELANIAGDYFTSLTVVAGFAWKSELPLANFYKKHLEPRIGGSHQTLLCGLGDQDALTVPHLVQSLDWFFPTVGEIDGWAESVRSQDADERRKAARQRREHAENESRRTLSGQPKLLRAFERHLSVAQRFVPIRDEQVSTFTLAWPVMRRALRRLAEHLVQRDVLMSDDEIYFLTRDELTRSLHASAQMNELAETARQRRHSWERQRAYTPPLLIGETTFFVKQMEQMLSVFGTSKTSDTENVVRGLAASPGHVDGPVRRIRGVSEQHHVRSGDVLVTPAPTPALTPLYSRAAAIVTDTGSPAAHAMVIAREFGIPAVVATANATSRLQDGQIVRVDGNGGFVEVLSR